jgi:hypothetical protein
MHADVCMLVFMLMLAIPYKNVTAKCISLAWLGFEIIPLIESICKILEITVNFYPVALQSIMAIAFCFWYSIRPSQEKNIDLDDVHIFLCRLKPRCVQDIILAMIGKSALGGVAVYYQGNLWQYKRGFLVRTRLINKARYVISQAGIPANTTITHLNEMIGTKWTLRENCITTLYAAVKLGYPLFRRK